MQAVPPERRLVRASLKLKQDSKDNVPKGALIPDQASDFLFGSLHLQHVSLKSYTKSSVGAGVLLPDGGNTS